ncbi:glycosyltransferase 87 family protein [Kribbella solani]|uniref:Alpha-1,2-mannosyltransferase n=1 Tax=Kribbella solani TaxID=236067 RepID=A0A841DZU3_9ACTN|nr:glycosyltransferase 87 family protein [Kribbella solani]MBB5982285.1 alpha-1,2-mannosyltransferase [Kribbella solani]
MTISPVRPTTSSRPPALRTNRRRTALLAAAAAVFLGLCLLRWNPFALQYDLRVYVVASRAFLHGQDIYTAHHAFPKDMLLGFTYPPFAALVFVPVALLGTGAGRAVMTLASASALIVIGLVTVRALRPNWSRYSVAAAGLAVGAAGVALEPVRSSFDLGQINLLLLAMLLVDLLGHLPRRYRGVLVGIATGIKLTPGIFILYLLVTRRFREAVVASAATAATMLAGAIAMPTGTWQFFTKYMLDPSRPGATHFISNQSWRGVFARLAGGVQGIAPAWALAVALTLAIGLWTAKRAYDHGYRLESILLTALTGVLISPISWTGHFVWALPICALLWFRVVEVSSGKRPVLVAFAALWTVSIAFGLPWTAPHLGDKEYTLRGFDLFLGNSYAICAATTILLGAYEFRRRKSIA